MKQSLSIPEWSLLTFFLVLIATFVFIAKVGAYRAKDAIGRFDESAALFLVTVEGAVKKPGEYQIFEGEPLETVLKKARPRVDADLRGLPLKKMVMGPMKIQVPALEEIRVSVSGALLEPLELSMPVGSRIADLKSKIGMTSETDKKFFRRKKLLRDGDKIVVPKKTVEGN